MLENQHEFKTLKELYLHPDKKQKIVGVILDATQSHQCSHGKDYQTKLKIIDETLNKDTDSKEITSEYKYMQVFIFTKEATSAPYIENIGDIIYLKRYDVSPFDNKFIKAKSNQVAGCQYYVFDGYPSENYEVKSQQQVEQYIPGDGLKKRIKQVREWQKVYFQTRSITDMWWFGQEYNQQEQVQVYQNREFDMILKVKSIQSTQPQLESLKHIQLVDGNNSLYKINFAVKGIEVNDLIKIRSIKQINDENYLCYGEYSSILKIPGYFYDQQKWKSIKYYQVQKSQDIKQINQQSYLQYPQNQSAEKQKQQTQASYDINLEEYDKTENKNITTYIKSKYRQQLENFERKSLKEFEIEREQFKQSKQESLFTLKKYLVSAYVIDIQPEELKDCLKQVCKQCKLSYSWPFKQVKCCDKPLTNLAQITFHVKDSSIDLDPIIEQLYVYSFDKNPNNLFPGIDLDEINEQNYEEMNKRYQQFREKLYEKTNLDYLCDFIIQPLTYENQVILRIIDTIFKDNI